ncbi:MAG: exodeoxyribonuclease VII large subunit, partial [Chloroflexota bacterium]|nr:exodeoxyribonuclease VII large subunit [Chloroflexota bacterium]
MPKRPPTGFNVRRAQQQRIDWDNSQPQPTEQPVSTPQSRPVGEVARHIKSQLKADPQLNDVWIEGEVRSFNRSGAGHYYFDLADSQKDGKSDAALACAFFRRDNRGMAVQQGDQVLVHGSADVYLPRGSLQIIVDDLRPIGEGVLQAEFERLFRNLNAEGLFNPERKRSLPPYPRRIGVVTSPSGAVWHDIQQVLSRRWPLTSLVLSPCLTQGAGAAESIAEGIQRLNLLTVDEPDLIIVARGGGSPEDLWAYNEEPVARAIFASDIPVISAVGHETDVSIADHVADRRAPTPSAAAEIAVPDRAEEAARVAGLRQAADQKIDSRIVELAQRGLLSRERL